MPFSSRPVRLLLMVALLGLGGMNMVACEAVDTAKAAAQTLADLDRNLRRPLTQRRLKQFMVTTPKLMNDAKKEGLRIPIPNTQKPGAWFDATDFDHLGKIVPFFKRHQADFAEWIAVLLKSQDALAQLSGQKTVGMTGKNGWSLQPEEIEVVKKMQKRVKQTLAKVPR